MDRDELIQKVDTVPLSQEIECEFCDFSNKILNVNSVEASKMFYDRGWRLKDLLSCCPICVSNKTYLKSELYRPKN